jgi:putative membrane protein
VRRRISGSEFHTSVIGRVGEPYVEIKTDMKTFPRLFPAAAPLIAILSLGLGSLSFAENAAVNASDKSFLKNAYQDGLAEVKAGEMGVRKTGNADVKAFAEHMVKDHTATNSELRLLAESKKVELPTEPSLIAQGKAKRLDAKTGADFEKGFAETMVSDHKKAVSAFEKASNEAADADVKAFAAKTLPTLKSHLSMAEELQKKIGK